ncbi:S8 family peptidase [Streptomyces sp. NPDC006385]|uniref:S8 family peptidase n=1 Tax=Streptomyces sp. NPDC006385 TaxID=3156761 RepID=UPI0033BA817A
MAQATAVPSAGSAAKGAAPSGQHRLTLITGDRVVVDAEGRVVGVERAKGREHVPVQTRTVGGHTLVIPMDAAPLIAAERLDQRLFDVTELGKAAVRESRRDGLKVIVGYKGDASTARSGVRDSGTLRRTFPSLNADAVQTRVADTRKLWDALTNGNRAASGIAHVWLDGVRRASLDTSVPQIGVPTAWAKGYDGKGVKVAVLDTGVDTTHPDLRTQVIAAKNFTSARDTGDHFGHGTHVASIVAGTGAKSGGTYKGVAPGAKILNGKVLNDEGGGEDSDILAGVEWAAQQGADIVNLSLGSADAPGVDPLETAVNKLSEQKGILFAIAAGNEGEGGAATLDSPGSAANALTVGAVDGKDALASFSSRGPTADGTLKPDVTAPGVDITAASVKGSVIAEEYGEKPAGYVTISGTSMATPHVAGAAALLKQQHPDWRFSELKAVLSASSKAGDYAPFQGGAGRIQVDKALGQSVVAEPSALEFPVQQWPHTDDTPVTRRLTYRNHGTKDVTLALSATARDPRGKAAPAGFFTLGAKTVTVPAGGRASVGVTVNSKLGGTLDGGYSARVTATGGGQSVGTSVGVMRETEHYDVTLKYVNRAGQHPKHLASLTSIDGQEGTSWLSSGSTDDSVTVRVPKGSYTLESVSAKNLTSYTGGVDWLVAPRLTVTRNMTVTLDLNRTRSPDITVPDRAARPKSAWVSYKYYAGTSGQNGSGVLADSFSDIRVAHLGPAVDHLAQTWSGQWTKGRTAEYDIAAAAPVKKLKGAYVRHYKAGDLATLKVGMGASAPGKTGAVTLTGTVPDGYGYLSAFADAVPQKLPGTRTYHVSAVGGVEWRPDFYQYSGKLDSDGKPVPEVSSWVDDYLKLKAGRTYRQKFNAAVIGPRMTAGGSIGNGVFRDGDKLYGALSLFADGAGHTTESAIASATTTLYRNGVKVGSNSDPLTGKEQFKVPAGAAAYKLTTSVRRGAALGAASSRIDATWTFRSQRPSGGESVRLPASTAHFGAATGLDSKVTAGRKATFPVTVEGPAKGRNLKSLSVYVSYDHGRTWKKVEVEKGKITVGNPAKGKAVSLRAVITDKKNNTSTISIHDAYHGK